MQRPSMQEMPRFNGCDTFRNLWLENSHQPPQDVGNTLLNIFKGTLFRGASRPFLLEL